MADFTDKVAKAREAGYSDDEIVQFLSSGDMSAKIKKAQEAGYSASEIVTHLGGAAKPTGPADASTALSDPEWAKKGRIIYRENNGSDFSGSDEEAAQYLNDYLYDFNYRLAGVGTDNARGTLDTAAQIAGYSDEGKAAFADAQTQFENMNTTLGGVGEATKRVLTDPTTYIGLGTFGLGTAGAQATKAAAKKGVTELAKIGAKQSAKRGAAVAATEGAAYGAASDLARQQAMVNAGGQEAIDPTQTLASAGIGAATGGVIGGTVGGIAGGVAGRNPTVRAARQLEADPQKALRGAEITQNISDVQATREVPMGLSDVNQQADVLRSDILKSLKELNLPNDKLQLYRERLTKARGLTANQVDELRTTPEGAVVADNIQVLKQMRDMVAPRASEGGVSRALRVGIDYAPIPRVVGDALKYAFLKPRRTGEEMIARTVEPKNLNIAREISRLGGQSDAAIGRQNLVTQVDLAKQAREAAKKAVDAKNAMLKETSLKLEREAILKNEVPSGGKFAYAHTKTGLKPQQVLDGMDELVNQGIVPPEVLKMFDEDPKKLYEGNVFNKILDRLNAMADSGMLARDEKWSPNTGNQVMQQGIDAIRYQAGVDQVKGLQEAAIAQPKDPRSQKIVVDAVQAMMAAGANQKARMAIFETALGRTKTPEERKAVASALQPLKEYFKSKYRGNRRAN